ncbi:MAG: hypothetical protein VZR23_10170 [Lachnospiraceae bacterium]|nr:hypothetical protein [Lachnospiraceae bacterium]
MSCIVYQTDKKTGAKYAYESVSYWDAEKQQPRSKRKYIGRVDPETGEIITGRRKRRSDIETAALSNDQDDTKASVQSIAPDLLREKDAEIAALRRENALIKKEKQEILSFLAKILGQYQE